ncbi:sensor histidine kinase [Cryobacterium sp. MDB1-18-2]|uniref:sensor histidine kinase n=1 Tax=unclassified Cryobacterium TaxID=2649013 RepID=UPI00106B7C2A|nr:MULTISPECIES: sensor histidine kinase [unclassified Cryobacterium]TFC32354.1 sensor histidine kinase [Cryobacterium sp. MDB1-18-2]TFC46079.1 sensor histidine kinase [Cryobacterium sp. MDB1-18-1]
MTAHGSGLDSVFLGLRVSLHLLVLGLVVLVVAMAGQAGMPAAGVIICLSAVLLGTYATGTLVAYNLPSRSLPGWALAWTAALSLEWVVLTVFSPEAIYLLFPLFFIYLHLLPGWTGPAAIALATGIAIVAFGVHRGFSVGGVIGPVIGAVVAVVIGLAYRSLTREARERDLLIAELQDTRTQLAAAERAAGVLDERGRLAREIHDTVSQSLSSIVLLLHAAERSADSSAAVRMRVGQARDAATQALGETRSFIDELSPPALRQTTLVEALRRLAAETDAASGVPVNVTISGDIGLLPTRLETALLRIAQGSLANAVQHARAGRIDLTLSRLDSEVILDVVDDGVGFDPESGPQAVPAAVVPAAVPTARNTFGLHAMRERVTELGGTLTVESTRPDGDRNRHGTSVVASFELAR